LQPLAQIRTDQLFDIGLIHIRRSHQSDTGIHFPIDLFPAEVFHECSDAVISHTEGILEHEGVDVLVAQRFNKLCELSKPTKKTLPAKPPSCNARNMPNVVDSFTAKMPSMVSLPVPAFSGARRFSDARYAVSTVDPPYWLR